MNTCVLFCVWKYVQIMHTWKENKPLLTLKASIKLLVYCIISSLSIIMRYQFIFILTIYIITHPHPILKCWSTSFCQIVSLPLARRLHFLLGFLISFILALLTISKSDYSICHSLNKHSENKLYIWNYFSTSGEWFEKQNATNIITEVF